CKEIAEVVHEFVIDIVDAEREAVLTVFGYQFAFQRVNFLDHVVEPLEKCDVIEVFRTKAGDRLAGKPAALVVGVKNFEVAAFDFDDQPKLLGKLKLVSMVFRSAVDEIADVDWTRLHPRVEVVCTAQTNSGIDFRSIFAFGPQVAHFGSRRSLNFRNDISNASYSSRCPLSVV